MAKDFRLVQLESKGGATLDLTIFRGLAKIQEVTVLISDEWRMVIS